MPAGTLILVLIVREAGLRSTLAARLSMAGADIVTADHFDDPRFARGFASRPVLIVDEPALAERPGGLPALLADPRWRALAVIGQRAGEGDPPRLLFLDRAAAAAAIEGHLPRWRGMAD